MRRRPFGPWLKRIAANAARYHPGGRLLGGRSGQSARGWRVPREVGRRALGAGDIPAADAAVVRENGARQVQSERWHVHASGGEASESERPKNRASAARVRAVDADADREARALEDRRPAALGGNVHSSDDGAQAARLRARQDRRAVLVRRRVEAAALVATSLSLRSSSSRGSSRRPRRARRRPSRGRSSGAGRPPWCCCPSASS